MDLPKGWEAINIDTLFHIVGGGTPSTIKTDYWDETGTPWFSSADISDNGEITSRRHVTGLGVENSTTNIVPAGSVIVVTRVGLGKVAILKKEMCFSQDNQALIPMAPETLHNRYVFYCLYNTMQTMKYSGRGTTISGITKKQLADYPFPLPSLAEQHRIVAKIDALFSKLDKGVETLQTIRQQLKTYRQAVLKWAFDNTTFEKHSLKKVSIAFGGAAFKSSDFLSEGKYQVVKIGNVRPGVVRLWEKPAFIDSIDGYERYLLQKCDVIITLTGTRKKRDYGFSAIITQENLLLNQRVAAIRFSKEYLPKFFMYYSWTKTFQDDFFADETGNVGQGNVGMKAITETLVPYCSLEEQAQIVAAIESRLSICDKLESIVDESLAKAAALRQSILKKAFAGQLVPQDPDDEPAEMLLKRIKAGTPRHSTTDPCGSTPSEKTARTMPLSGKGANAKREVCP